VAMRLHMDFELPDALTPRSKAAVEKDLREEAVLGIFERRLCSGGFAAKLLGLQFSEFLDVLKEHNIPYSRGSKAATTADRRAVARWGAERKQRSSSR
jgi:predicted HTH domain antitoxin